MTKIVYDEYYKEEKYFGAPYKGLVKFFKTYEPKGKVLDLGCGQGRDSLQMAKLGYDVIAVDHSKVGIDQLKKISLKAGLKINALVGDVYKIKIDESIDMILLDAILHFYKNQVMKESEFVIKLLKKVKIGGIFINLMLKGDGREKILKEIMSQSKFEWDTLVEKYVDHPESASKYHMLVIKKKGHI